MDDRGLVEEPGELKVSSEPVSLRLVRAVLAEVVEACLAYSDTLRERAEGRDLFSNGIVGLLDVMGVNAGGGEEAFVPRR